MNTKIQKRLAAQILKGSIKRVTFDPEAVSEIKEAITKADIRSLIKSRAIIIKNKKGVSKSRARKIRAQKRKGRQRGQGSRKGTANARSESKREWINKIRLQRELLKTLIEKGMIAQDIYRDLYRKSKGGFFRNKRHLKFYLKEHNLLNEQAGQNETQTN